MSSHDTAMTRFLSRDDTIDEAGDGSFDAEEDTIGGSDDSGSSSTSTTYDSGDSFSSDPSDMIDRSEDDSGSTSTSSDDTASVEVTDVQATQSPSAQERQRAQNSDDDLSDVVQESREDNDPSTEDVVAGMPEESIENVVETGDADTNIGSDDTTIGDVAEEVGIDSDLVGTGTADDTGQSSTSAPTDQAQEQIAALEEQLASVTQQYNSALSQLAGMIPGQDSEGGILPSIGVAGAVVAVVVTIGVAVSAGGN